MLLEQCKVERTRVVGMTEKKVKKGNEIKTSR